MNFEEMADKAREEASRAGKDLGDAQGLFKQNESKLLLRLEQTLATIGAGAAKYLSESNVKPVPVGKTQQLLPGFKKVRFVKTGEAWALGEKIYVETDGTFAIYSSDRVAHLKSVGLLLGGGVMDKISNAPRLTGESLFGLFKGAVGSETFLTAQIHVHREHDLTITFHEDGRLDLHSKTDAVQSPPVDFAQWIASNVGRIASQ